MNKKLADNFDPRVIAADFFRRLGGMEGMTKWGKVHRSLAYQLIAKLMSQPLVQQNVNIANITHDDGEGARRKLEDAFMRLIESRKASVGDPAVYVNDMRLGDDGSLIEHHHSLTRDPPPLAIDIQPSSDDAQPATDDGMPGSRVDVPLNESSTSPQQGTGFSREPAATGAGAGKNKNFMKTFPSVAGACAGSALDGSDDNRSTTEKYLTWSGHGKPP
jgi:hypothetical protein